MTSLQSPTTQKQHRAVVVPPHIAASGQACGRWLGEVVGRFLAHACIVFFLPVFLQESTGNNHDSTFQ